jgi:fibronectin type 3 domain-containing protein
LKKLLSIVPLLALLTIVVAWPGHSQGNHAITLTWNASAGATSYNVKRSTSAGTEVTIGTTTTLTYVDTNGVAGTQYFYVVTAVNQFGESGPSNEVAATFLGDRPPAPTGLAGAAK